MALNSLIYLFIYLFIYYKVRTIVHTHK